MLDAGDAEGLVPVAVGCGCCARPSVLESNETHTVNDAMPFNEYLLILAIFPSWLL